MELVLYKYCNPYADNSKYKDFVIQGEYVKIYQNKENGIGWTFWDCVRE
jgi:hypothetical protein